jgi:hypothetical protein
VHKLSLQPNTPDKNKRKKREKVEMSWVWQRRERRNGVGLAEKRKKKWPLVTFLSFFFGSFEFKIISDQFFSFFLLGFF